MQLRKLLYLALILLTTPIPTTAQFYLSLFSEFNIHDIPAIPTKSLDTRCRALPILQDIASVRNDSTLATSFSNWLSTNQSISNSSLIIQQAQAVLVQLEGYTALAQLCEDAAQVEGTCNATSIAAVNVTLCDNFKAYKSSLPETNAALKALGVSDSIGVVTTTVQTNAAGSATATVSSTYTPTASAGSSAADRVSPARLGGGLLAGLFAFGTLFI